VPTLLGITLITFLVIQLAPGSPVERKLQLEEGIKAESITKDIIEQKEIVRSINQYTFAIGYGYAQ
jgi:peptide/nickel transport system permease protein